MRYTGVTRCALLIALSALAPLLSADLAPEVYAETPYSLNPVPAFAQEGTTISLVLTVYGATSNTLYVFRFFVRDPAGKAAQSAYQNYTTRPGQSQFSILVSYPTPTFSGSNSLAGQYATWVEQLGSVTQVVATSSFVLSIVDNTGYERTQTVSVQASGYNGSETVTVIIRTQTSSTLVFSQTVSATSTGVVGTSWKIPVNATIDNYMLTLTGTSTVKTPPDRQQFSVKPAGMSIPSISSSQTTYQRTENMQFSFQPKYPDGSIASTGVGLLTLARPDGGNVTLTATYDSASQSFATSYKTSADNQTGTWNATLTGHGYSDAYGNNGPGTILSNTPQVTPATLAVNVRMDRTDYQVGEQVKFNATIIYPDGTIFQSGTVGAYLLSSEPQAINQTAPMIFDTSLRVWIGTYTWQSGDAGGLWSLNVKASDSSTPADTGSATRAVSLQNSTASGNASLPLYYFGIAAAVIAGGLVGAFLFFRRRRVTHASLKIDLEAVRSEAGKIESQEFFKSVKGQVRKDKED